MLTFCVLVLIALAAVTNASNVVDFAVDFGLDAMVLPSSFDLDVSALGIPATEVKRSLAIGAEQTFAFDTTIVLAGVAANVIPAPAKNVLITALSTASGVAASGISITEDVVTGTSPSFTHTITIHTNLNTETVTGFVDYRDIGVVYYGAKNGLLTFMNSGFLVAALKSFSIQGGNVLFASTTLSSHSFSQSMETTPEEPMVDDDDKNLKRGKTAATVILSVFGFFVVSGIAYYYIVYLRANKPKPIET